MNLAALAVIVTIFFLPLSTALSNVSFAGAIVLSLFAGNIRKIPVLLLENPVALLFFSLFILYVIGMSYSSASFDVSLHFLLKYDKFLLALLLFPLFRNEQWRDYAIAAFAASMLITLVLSYMKYFGLLHWHDEFGPASVFRKHITSNYFMAIFAYLLAWQAILKPRFQTWIVPVLILTVFNVLLMSEGRTGYIVLISLLMLFCYQRYQLQGMVIALVMSGILLTLSYLVSANFHNRIHYLMQSQKYSSISLRKSFINNSLRIIKANPIIGTGTGSVGVEIAKIESDKQYQTDNPHNEFLNMSVQLGTIGLLFLCVFTILPWYYSFQLPLEHQYLAQGVIVSMAVGNLGNSFLMDSGEGHLFVCFMVVVFACLKNPIKFALSPASGAVVE